jgi:hypothetical protein
VKGADMNIGVTVYMNGFGYYFDDYKRLEELLDDHCNDANQTDSFYDNAVIFDEE